MFRKFSILAVLAALVVPATARADDAIDKYTMGPDHALWFSVSLSCSSKGRTWGMSVGDSNFLHAKGTLLAAADTLGFDTQKNCKTNLRLAAISK